MEELGRGLIVGGWSNYTLKEASQSDTDNVVMRNSRKTQLVGMTDK